MKNNKIIFLLKAVFYAMRPIGLLSFVFERKTNKFKMQNSYSNVYLLLELLFMGACFYEFNLKNITYDNEQIVNYVTLIFLNLRLCCHIAKVISSRKYKQEMFNVWDKILNFENKFNLFSHLYSQYEIIYICFVIIFLPFLIKFFITLKLSTNNFLNFSSLFYPIVHSIMELYSNVIKILFICFLWIFCRQFDHINRKLLNISVDGKLLKKYISEFTKAHVKICEIKSVLIKIISASILSLFCENFWYLSITVYSLISNFYRSPNKFIWNSSISIPIFWIFDGLITLLTLTFPPYLCSKNVCL